MIETAVTSAPILTQLLKYGPIALEQSMPIADFLALDAAHPDLLMEREATGKVKIMSFFKKDSEEQEDFISSLIGHWSVTNNLGRTYGYSKGIQLPNGAIKIPDFAWISDERLAAAEKGDSDKFIKAVPDFVVKVRSSVEKLKKLKLKMEKLWMANGVQLAWLIDPFNEKVWIYRAGQETEEINDFKGKSLSGEEVLKGLELPLERLSAKK